MVFNQIIIEKVELLPPNVMTLHEIDAGVLLFMLQDPHKSGVVLMTAGYRSQLVLHLLFCFLVPARQSDVTQWTVTISLSLLAMFRN